MIKLNTESVDTVSSVDLADELEWLLVELAERWVVASGDSPEERRLSFSNEIEAGFRKAQLVLAAKAMQLNVTSSTSKHDLAAKIATRMYITDVAERAARIAEGPFDAFRPVPEDSQMGVALQAGCKFNSPSKAEGLFAKRYQLAPSADLSSFKLSTESGSAVSSEQLLADQEQVVGILSGSGEIGLVWRVRGADEEDYFTLDDGTRGRRWKLAGFMQVQDRDEAKQVLRAIRRWWSELDADQPNPSTGEVEPSLMSASFSELSEDPIELY